VRGASCANMDVTRQSRRHRSCSLQRAVAIDEAGKATALWRDTAGISKEATRSLGGSFSAAVDLPIDFDANAIAFNRAGDAVAAWNYFNGSNHRLRASVRLAGGGFSAPVDISTPTTAPTDPAVAISTAGEAIVVWGQRNATNSATVVQVSLRPPGGNFSDPIDLSVAAPWFSEPWVAINEAGAAVVALLRSDGGHLIAQAAVRPPGGGFSALVDVSPAGPDASRPEPAIDSTGNVIVGWTTYDATFDWPGPATPNVVMIATRPAGGSFSSPVELSVPGEPSSGPLLGFDDGGEALAVWTGVGVVKAAVRPPGGSFGAPVAISPPAAGADDLAINAAGDAVVSWHRNGIVQAAIRPAGSGFSAPTHSPAQR